MEQFCLYVGKFFVFVGGVALCSAFVALFVYIACQAWIAASNRFRDILKAESLIYRYRKEEKLFRKWLEEKEGDTY